MRVHLVGAHPVPESYNMALRARALATLEAAGHDVDLLDLCADARPDQHRSRLDRAEAVVLVYPTWWGGPPAVMKDWIDRCWPEPGNPTAPGRLDNLARLAVVTTHGSGRLRNGVQGEPGRRLIGRGLRSCCRRGTRVEWIAMYDMDRSTPEKRRAFLDRVERDLGAW